MSLFNLKDKQDPAIIRMGEYPSLGDQIDAMWKGGVDAVEMRKQIREVKLIYVPGLSAFDRKKAILQAEALTLRDIKRRGGCPLPPPFNVTIDTTEESLTNISGLVQKAMIQGPAFTIIFRMEDNSEVPLNAEQMITVGLIVSDHLEACQMSKNAADAAINACTTIAELEALDLPSYYEFGFGLELRKSTGFSEPTTKQATTAMGTSIEAQVQYAKGYLARS